MDLKINGKIWPLRFGFSSIIDFCREQDLEMEDFAKWVVSMMNKDKINFEDLERFAVLVWHGIKCGCYYEKFDFSLEKVEVIDCIVDETILYPAFMELLKSMPANSKDQKVAEKKASGGTKKK